MNKNDVFPKRAVFEKDEAGSDVAKAAGGDGFMDATFSSLSMILVSEVFISANVTVQSLIFWCCFTKRFFANVLFF